ncbi:hypothetical protein GH810_05260 [Acetobacterium paludosum]|uniref:Uncharacterized protein n=1 Tax=Acetobacterium paludosum TaxID=52693 RepID=A0A923I069_9FIRM|nr:hypothetical protein [Acetobacterium paludosum]MBC3887713.1 hypothetical protein [Acetobacterium paludosum]
MNLNALLKRNKQFRWIILMLTIIVPCSGYVLLGRSARGLMMLMWMFVLGYLTSHLTIYFSDLTSITQYFGAVTVWIASILEINHEILKILGS